MTAPGSGRRRNVMNQEPHRACTRKRVLAPTTNQPELTKSSRNCTPMCPPRAASWWAQGDGRRDPAVMRDMRAHNIDMPTLGQYWPPATATCPCAATHPDTFKMLRKRLTRWAFSHVAVAPWRAAATTRDQQAHAAGVSPAAARFQRPPMAPERSWSLWRYGAAGQPQPMTIPGFCWDSPGALDLEVARAA